MLCKKCQPLPLNKVGESKRYIWRHLCVCFSFQVKLLGHGQPLHWTTLKVQNGITVELPHLTSHQMPCKWGWALALTNVM